MKHITLICGAVLVLSVFAAAPPGVGVSTYTIWLDPEQAQVLQAIVGNRNKCREHAVIGVVTNPDGTRTTNTLPALTLEQYLQQKVQHSLDTWLGDSCDGDTRKEVHGWRFIPPIKETQEWLPPMPSTNIVSHGTVLSNAIHKPKPRKQRVRLRVPLIDGVGNTNGWRSETVDLPDNATVEPQDD